MARNALVLALAGIVAVLSGGLLFLTAGSATSVPMTQDAPCVPSDPWTETIEHPEVSHVETVVVTPAVPAVPGQHYSLKGSSGIEGDAVPPAPDVKPEFWQENTEQEPHLGGNDGKNVTWYPVDPATSGLHYTSVQGNRNWFYFRAPVPAQPEVTEQVTVVDEEAWTETIEHPAVVCPTEPPTTVPPTTVPPTTPAPTAQPPEVLPTTATPAPTPAAEPSEPADEEPADEVTQQPSAQPDDVEVMGVQAPVPPVAPTAVPTAIDAGLPAGPGAGASTAQLWGVVLAAMGTVLLVSAGGVLVRIRHA
ncbi:MAG TPA: hypothetical protein VFR45_08540 [Nocardioides sp.]|nr:hypothetical protein [Nocardioides sp.]